ncbi:MAG: 7,8-didemethyl-8-hydroxy-5-deazariboflavin synthase subunit CofG [Candidatus Nitrosopelagicus sp.]|nr:7,8-didemethyl-8-hydroxy-5-deazariboflavin synthase subunit CofG [Candidatus Nitrosopelagicus sp.]
MSKLQFDFEIIHKIGELKEITEEEVLELSKNAPKQMIFDAASKIRDKRKGKAVSFSKKAFFNIINMCRDTCSYCTYKAEPNDTKLSLMDKKTVRELAVLAKKYNCTEALFVTGERPEQKYPEAKKWLASQGFSSTAEYLIHCSEMVLNEGVFPHTNAGNLSKDEMRELQKTNVSMGLMLENSSPRLREIGMPHHNAPSKEPSTRLNILKNSGELKIPMTTGILVGIGESMEENIQSIFDIKKIDDRYGNIQEIILQNFHPKPKTSMSRHSTPEEDYFKMIVALCRIIMPNANIQIPPNLSPENYHEFLSVGINDWGGISPITSDYVNPEFSWPNIQNVEKKCNDTGFSFKARFPVYPEFIPLVNNDLKQRISLIADEENYVKESYWK